MDDQFEQYEQLIETLSKGDTSLVESFIGRPGGRKYLERITCILINALPKEYGDKEVLFQGFVEVLDRMEVRIRRQQEGEAILNAVLKNDE